MAKFRSYPVYHPLWKLAAVCAVALVGIAAGALVRGVSPADPSARSIDWSAYDLLFRLRPPQDRANGPVALVVIDDLSLQLIEKYARQSWPWPRETYGQVIQAAQEAGARAVVFDFTFDGPSVYDHFADDSKALADAADAARVPVIFGVQSPAAPGQPPLLAIPTRRGIVGAVDVPPGATVLRSYRRSVNGLASLAMAAATAVDPRAADPNGDNEFLLHYYGPFGTFGSEDEKNRPTHRRLFISDLVLPRFGSSGSDIHPVDPALLRGKIVVVGAIAHGLYDQKSSPYSAIYPGVDYQATAIENLLDGSRVDPAGRWLQAAALVLPCLLAGLATIFARLTVVKIMVPVAVAALVLAAIYALFRHDPIVFVPPTAPLTGLGVATLLGLTWSYFTEGRQRRFLSRAFSQYVSPGVVEELERDPAALTLGSRRRTVTILFSDIRSFTTISETLASETLEKFMNLYLGAMTDVVLAGKGTVDKYIGDAVMAFWNAPLDQPDHARRAVSAALGLARREGEIQPQLRALAGGEIYTRIGLATGEVNVGNFGSAEKLNYTVLGDWVNLASRLEGANKIYGSKILLAETTALAVQDHILVRKLGLLQVKGKGRAVAVYEALCERPGTPEQIDRKRCYESAFDHYLNRRWRDARAALESLIRDHPEDAPAAKLLDAVAAFEAQPPPGDWDGVYVAHEK